jgi:phosphoribosylamine-glycine ligase
VAAKGANLTRARKVAYDAVRSIKIAGSHYRKDIGAKAAKKFKG